LFVGSQAGQQLVSRSEKRKPTLLGQGISWFAIAHLRLLQLLHVSTEAMTKELL
jgi:hypothetical protein